RTDRSVDRIFLGTPGAGCLRLSGLSSKQSERSRLEQGSPRTTLHFGRGWILCFVYHDGQEYISIALAGQSRSDFRFGVFCEKRGQEAPCLLTPSCCHELASSHCAGLTVPPRLPMTMA